jgi:Histone acetylation protein/Zinc finger, ZZ type
MSDALEKGLHDALHAAYRARSAELDVAFDDIEKANGLCVRVLSNVEKKNLVGERMLQRYKFKDYPSEFPLRSKCVALFQKIHGVDTLLFAMYVYEYGDDCPAPNRRHVYISYLDSVRYFEPKCYRTTAYHAIIVEYLRYVKKRGFHTASIWSCPPVNGDDYIFYCHPKHQLVPREDMLRAWYHKMLDQAKAQGIVLSTSTLYDEYFSSERESNGASGQLLTPTCLPYFDGDYIPGELEIIIQQCEANGDKISDLSTHDTVMVRLGHNLLKMKDNFIVIHLRNKRFVDAVQRGEDVSHWKEDSDDDMVRSKRAKISAKLSPESDLGKSQAVDIAKPVTKLDDALSSNEYNPMVAKLDVTTDNLCIDTATVASMNDTTARNNPTASVSDDGESKVVREVVQHCVEKSMSIENINIPSTSHPELGSIDVTESDNVGMMIDKAAEDHAAVPIVKIDEPLLDGKQSHGVIKTSDDETCIDPVNSAAAAEVTSSNADKPVDDVALSDNVDLDPVATLTSKGESLVENPNDTVGPVSADTVVDAVNAATTNREVPMNSAFPNISVSNATDKSFERDIIVTETNQAPTSTQDTPKIDHSVETAESATEDLDLTRKRALDDFKPAIENHFGGLMNPVENVSDTSDDDPPMESEMFESRQQFLNYCQSAHCQFDELRRAKHSTVMVLFQLHNPSAPKFLQQCGACYRDITHGIRHHCNDCSNFDLCEDCYDPIVAGTWAKRDPRFAHDDRHTFTAIDMESTDDTPKSQADRQNSLKTHVKLLEHAAFCGGPPTCSLHNCDRFKKIFLHCSACDIKPKRECKICTRLLVLCTMHTRLCNSRDPCPVPFCDRIRERNKRLCRQQQLMDDRRRQAQNELYHAGSEN